MCHSMTPPHQLHRPHQRPLHHCLLFSKRRSQAVPLAKHVASSFTPARSVRGCHRSHEAQVKSLPGRMQRASALLSNSSTRRMLGHRARPRARRLRMESFAFVRASSASCLWIRCPVERSIECSIKSCIGSQPSAHRNLTRTKPGQRKVESTTARLTSPTSFVPCHLRPCSARLTSPALVTLGKLTRWRSRCSFSPRQKPVLMSRQPKRPRLNTLTEALSAWCTHTLPTGPVQ